MYPDTDTVEKVLDTRYFPDTFHDTPLLLSISITICKQRRQIKL